MGSTLELYDARLSYIRFADRTAELHFSYAYIHRSKGGAGGSPATGWSQEAILLLEAAQATAPLPPLPNVIVEGFLQVDGTRYELIPLPFEREGACELHLEFSDGAVLDVRGEYPLIKLQGAKVFLEGFT